MKKRKKNKRKPPQQAREKTLDDPGARASSKLAKELIDATEIVEGITGVRLLAAGSSERRRTPWARAGGTLRKGDERRSTAPIGGKILPVASMGAIPPAGRAEAEKREVQQAENSLAALKSWQEVEIAFLSDERVKINSSGDRGSYNYAELDFEDRRNGKPNRAWVMLREMARHDGSIPRPLPGKDKTMVQKRIEEIRKKLRGRFRIESDPIPFNGNAYQASFKISCRPSFET